MRFIIRSAYALHPLFPAASREMPLVGVTVAE